MSDEISNSLGLAPMDEVIEGKVVIDKKSLPICSNELLNTFIEKTNRVIQERRKENIYYFLKKYY